jgi:hypothetical protein
VHFTYKKPKGDLQQGDLLRKTKSLRDVLSEFHPYYATHPDYAYLMVLTQSCDLALYNGNCKARYITLAAIRPVETAIERELSKYQHSSVEVHGNLCSRDNEQWIRDFLIKLFNNNISEFFYLAEDAEFDLDKAYAAFLKLAIPVKAEHYKECLSARFAQLEEIFQAKLGWLVGNIYSRVGTPDWVPVQTTQDNFNNRVEDTLKKICLWVDDHILKDLNKEQQRRRKVEGKKYVIPQDELIELITKYIEKQEDIKDESARLIVKHIKEALPHLSPDDFDRLERQLMYNEEIRRFLK